MLASAIPALLTAVVLLTAGSLWSWPPTLRALWKLLCMAPPLPALDRPRSASPPLESWRKLRIDRQVCISAACSGRARGLCAGSPSCAKEGDVGGSEPYRTLVSTPSVPRDSDGRTSTTPVKGHGKDSALGKADEELINLGVDTCCIGDGDGLRLIDAAGVTTCLRGVEVTLVLEETGAMPSRKGGVPAPPVL